MYRSPCLGSGDCELPGDDDRAGWARAAPGGFGRDSRQVVMPKLAGRTNDYLTFAVGLNIKNGAAHWLAFAQKPELIIALWWQRLQTFDDQDGQVFFWRAEQMGVGIGGCGRAGKCPDGRMR